MRINYSLVLVSVRNSFCCWISQEVWRAFYDVQVTFFQKCSFACLVCVFGVGVCYYIHDHIASTFVHSQYIFHNFRKDIFCKLLRFRFLIDELAKQIWHTMRPLSTGLLVNFGDGNKACLSCLVSASLFSMLNWFL